MKKRLLSIVMGLALLSCFIIASSAIEEPNVVARLNDNMSVAYSSTTAGTHKLFEGSNSSSSDHRVYFEAQRSAGDKFVKDAQVLVSKGTSIDNILTSFTGSTQLWRLELNPYGVATKGCTATGYMWYKM